jgi:hypothetical protein
MVSRRRTGANTANDHAPFTTCRPMPCHTRYPATRDRVTRRCSARIHNSRQLDDEGNDRQLALDLFDAFGSKEKTLHANLGGHAGVPWFEVDNGARFFARHLK